MNKDFIRGDQIRDELRAAGIQARPNSRTGPHPDPPTATGA